MEPLANNPDRRLLNYPEPESCCAKFLYFLMAPAWLIGLIGYALIRVFFFVGYLANFVRSISKTLYHILQMIFCLAYVVEMISEVVLMRLNSDLPSLVVIRVSAFFLSTISSFLISQMWMKSVRHELSAQIKVPIDLKREKTLEFNLLLFGGAFYFVLYRIVLAFYSFYNIVLWGKSRGREEDVDVRAFEPHNEIDQKIQDQKILMASDYILYLLPLSILALVEFFWLGNHSTLLTVRLASSLVSLIHITHFYNEHTKSMKNSFEGGDYINA